MNECFAKQHLDLVVRPPLRRQGLQKHDDTLHDAEYLEQPACEMLSHLEVHFLQFFAPPNKEGRTNV